MVHLAVLMVGALAGGVLWGLSGGISAVVGLVSFSVPVVLFSGLVVRASEGDTSRFWGRFMAAELLKWMGSALLLGCAFVSGLFSALPLLAGFLLSVFVQVFFPIFIRKESES